MKRQTALGYLFLSLVAFLHCHSLWANETVAAGGPALTFEQAVDEALRSNLDLLAAKYNISQAEADELTAGLWTNPSIQIDTSLQPFGGNWNQTNAGGPVQYDAVINIPFDLSGKHSTAKKSARFAVKIAEAMFQDSVRQKILEVKLAYIDVLTFDQQLTLSREKRDDLGRLVQMIKNKIGATTRLPLLQQRAVLARDQAALDVNTREVALRNAKTTLSALLGRMPSDDSVQTATSLREFTLVDLPPVETLVEKARAQRPDLKALTLTLDKAGADKESAEAQVWDNFNLGLGVSRQGPLSANPGDPTSKEQGAILSWQASLQIPLPFFNRNQGNIEKAVSVRGQTERQIQALRLSISQELNSLVKQFALNRHLIEEYEDKQLESARRVRDSQQTQYGTGNSSILDYFDAINAYYTTLSSYYDAVGEYRRGMSRVQASLGKDSWQ